MADENTGLVVIDIKPEQAPTLYVAGGLDSFLEYIREMTREVPDGDRRKENGTPYRLPTRSRRGHM
ncbi:hypothetical protein NUF78_003635 [Yersinia enterocolitica]|nr:hypothetical protein [Yersinia enterocolitica]